MKDTDKRRKAHPDVVQLLECPSCHQFGVPKTEFPAFCLKCRWRDRPRCPNCHAEMWRRDRICQQCGVGPRIGGE